MNILRVQGATPNAQENYVTGLLTGAGHTVTGRSNMLAIPDLTPYDLIVFTAFPDNADMTDWRDTPKPFYYLGATGHFLLLTTPLSAQQGTTLARQNEATFPELTAGKTSPLEYITGTDSIRFATAAQRATGLVNVWGQSADRGVVCALETGALRTDSSPSPGRRVNDTSLTSYSTAARWTADAVDVFLAGVTWLGGGQPLAPQTATAVEVLSAGGYTTDADSSQNADLIAALGGTGYVQSPSNPSNATLTVRLSDLLSADGQLVRYTYGKKTDNAVQINQTVQLRSPDGTALLREFVHTNVGVRPLTAEHNISDLTLSGQHQVWFIDTVGA
jgi:hypothetical protein